MKNRKSRQVIAGEVRGALARKGETQAWLSQRAGISRAALSRKMRGETSFSVDELLAVAIALDVDVATLVGPAIDRAQADAA